MLEGSSSIDFKILLESNQKKTYKGFNFETSVNCNLLSVDGVNDPEVLSINATSTAVALSDIPWAPAVGAVRLGLAAGRILVNPTRRQLSQRSAENMLICPNKSCQVGRYCTVRYLPTFLVNKGQCCEKRVKFEVGTYLLGYLPT